MFTTLFNADEILRPSILANADVVNSTRQYSHVSPCISSTMLPTSTNERVCIADITNNTATLEFM